MPNSSSTRNLRPGNGERTLAVGRMTEKSKPIHGQVQPASPAQLGRPKAQPDLKNYREVAAAPPNPLPASPPPRLMKLLLKVTVQRCLGPVQVLIQPEATVGDLIREAVRAYAREGRRPVLPTADPAGFDLHYSQFSFESLDSKEKLVGLGSRIFFLCWKPFAPVMDSCCKEAQKGSPAVASWLSFLDFLR